MSYIITVETIKQNPKEKYPSKEIIFEQKFEEVDLAKLAIFLNSK